MFESALGGSEEILGEITTELREIAENYDLTEEERRAKLQQLEDNQIRLIQETELLEDQQLELFGIRLPDDRMEKEVEDASSFWLSSKSIQRLVTLYLQKRLGSEREYILGERSLKTLRLSGIARETLLRDFRQLPRERSPVYREWENWLTGEDQHLAITFEADGATQDPKAAFIMPIHPLVKQAARTLETRRQRCGRSESPNRCCSGRTLRFCDLPVAVSRYQGGYGSEANHYVRGVDATPKPST